MAHRLPGFPEMGMIELITLFSSLTGLDLAAGFAPVDVSANETWVVSSELGFPEGRKDENNRVLLARILWKAP